MKVKHGCGSGIESLVGLVFGLPKLAAVVADTVGQACSLCSCHRCRNVRCRPLRRRDCDFDCDRCDCAAVCGCEQCAPETDVWLEARPGEVRRARILVENNQARPAQIQFEASPWLDACGREVPASTVHFDPSAVELAPGQAEEVLIEVKASAPLEAGMAYFGEIFLKGCPTRPISFGLCIAPDVVDHYAVCDPCRKRHSKFVDVCCEPCCSPDVRSCCGSPLLLFDPWAKCGWPGTWDPHKHWLESCSCQTYYLPTAHPRTEAARAP